MKKPVWERDPPKDHKSKSLSRKEIQSAKARARAAGQPYPSLVANIAALRKRKG